MSTSSNTAALNINFIPVNTENYASVMDALPEAQYYHEVALTGNGANLYTLYMRRGRNMRMGDMGCLGYDSGFKGIMGATVESAIAHVKDYFDGSAGTYNVLVFDGTGPNTVKREVLKFGKFRGKTIPEVMAAEGGNSWIMWLAKEIEKPTSRKHPKWLVAEIAEAKTAIIHEARERNRATSKSEYVGTLKERQALTMTCTSFKVFKAEYQGDEDRCVFNFVQGDNVLSVWAAKGTYTKGNTYTVKATPVKHIEVTGIKTTTLNRVAIVSIVEAVGTAEDVKVVDKVATYPAAAIEAVAPLVIESTLDIGITATECEVVGSITFTNIDGVNVPYMYSIVASQDGRCVFNDLARKGCACALCGKATREAVYLAQIGDYWTKRGMVCLDCAKGAKEDGGEAFNIAKHRDFARRDIQADVNRYGSRFLNPYRGIKP
jgi:hypothetical protein